MIYAALAFSALLIIIAGLLRAGGASLVRTLRADAMLDAAEGSKRAATVGRMLDDRVRLQPSLGMVHAGLLVVAAVPATWALARLTSGWTLLAALIGLAMIAVLLGDLVPRSIGRRRPRSLAYAFAPLLSAGAAVGRKATDLISEEEDTAANDEPSAQEAEEKELISSVLEFTDTIVREVMIPRTDMITLDGDADANAALDLVIESGKSRIPVTGDDSDDIRGTLYARDLLKLMDASSGVRASGVKTVSELMRDVYFVPETKRVSELLREMQANQIHLAVVVDEFGGTAGLVTIEDLIEELVGEIVDEYDEEEPMVTQVSAGEYLIDARLGVDELGDLIGAELPADGWDTVGGLVLGLAGRVPRQGEVFEFESHLLTAERVQGRRVAQVRISSRT